MNETQTKRAYVTIRYASFLIIVIAIVGAVTGRSKVAGLLLMTGFGLVGLAALLNVYLGFAKRRLHVGGDQVTKQTEPALFGLYLFLNSFLVVTIGLAFFVVIWVKLQ